MTNPGTVYFIHQQFKPIKSSNLTPEQIRTLTDSGYWLARKDEYERERIRRSMDDRTPHPAA